MLEATAKIIVLVGIVRLLIETGKPFLCAGIYAAVGAGLAVLAAVPFPQIAQTAAVSFVLAAIFFWVLDRFEGSFLWWVVFVAGLAIGLV
ncbi:MAG: hypothetical protein KDD47_23360 [Acidobacteria bacterium]|nr:hypothetical protein [Acidobacteriota bacterium]